MTSLKQRWKEMSWPTFLAWCMVPLEVNPVFQFYKGWVSGEMSQIAPLTFITVLIIGAIWMMYGYSIKSWPLVWSNVVKFIASSAVVILYFVTL